MFNPKIHWQYIHSLLNYCESYYLPYVRCIFGNMFISMVKYIITSICFMVHKTRLSIRALQLLQNEI